MILFTNEELRLHVPSNAIDDVALLQGILDNSEKDFLKDKLGDSLYKRLCEYYQKLDAQEFYMDVTNGTYTQHPWNELLLNAQRMIANDAMARFAYQQLISINGAGVNIASSNDYDAASEKLLDKGIAGYKKEAMVSLNNTLLLLENWAKKINTPMPAELSENNAAAGSDNSDNKKESTKGEKDESTDEGKDNGTSSDGSSSDVEETAHKEVEEIVVFWQESKYYYLHNDLLIPTCDVLQQYIDIYENRDKFIRLLPDIRFIQEEYVEDAFGEELVNDLLQAKDRDKLLKKVRRYMVARLEERTTVLSIDKSRKVQAHDEAISLDHSVRRMIEERKQQAKTALDKWNADRNQANADADGNGSASGDNSSNNGASANGSSCRNSSSNQKEGFQNEQSGSRIFVTPLLC